MFFERREYVLVDVKSATWFFECLAMNYPRIIRQKINRAKSVPAKNFLSRGELFSNERFPREKNSVKNYYPSKELSGEELFEEISPCEKLLWRIMSGRRIFRLPEKTTCDKFLGEESS
jgi:hypothetical protein